MATEHGRFTNQDGETRRAQARLIYHGEKEPEDNALSAAGARQSLDAGEIMFSAGG
jgi:hypothetical protein